RPPRSPLFPYTTLFRSLVAGGLQLGAGALFEVGEIGHGRDAIRWVRRASRRNPDVFGVHVGLAPRRSPTGFRSIRLWTRTSPGRSEEHTSELQSLAYLV